MFVNNRATPVHSCLPAFALLSMRQKTLREKSLQDTLMPRERDLALDDECIVTKDLDSCVRLLDGHTAHHL